MKTGEIKEMTEQRKSEGRREMNSVREKLGIQRER